MSRQRFIDQIRPSTEVIEKIDAYIHLLQEEQRHMNLVSNSSLPFIWPRHVIDSAQAFSFLPRGRAVILDLGSGAGFPGLVLATMDEKKEKVFHLTESEGRKCDFLNKVIEFCNLNAIVHNKRIEKIHPFFADFITARALTRLDKLLSYAKPFMKTATKCLFLKGKRHKEELHLSQKKWDFSFDVYPSLSSDEGRLLLISQVKKK